MTDETKTCPYCAETIKAAAIKCKHCGSMLNEITPESTSESKPQSLVEEEASESHRNEAKVLYQTDEILVSTTRVTIHGADYAIRNISSVSLSISNAPQGCRGLGYLNIGLLIALFGGFFCGMMPELRVALILVGVAAIAWGIYTRMQQEHIYNLEFETNSGRDKVLSHSDKEYIEAIRDSINTAIDSK